MQVADWVGEEAGHDNTDSVEPMNVCDIFLSKERNTCQLEGLFSRKQFFAETLRQGLKVLSGCIDGGDAGSNGAKTDHSADRNCISSDFSLTFLRQEARRLELDPDSINNEELLGVVYKAMEAQRSST